MKAALALMMLATFGCTTTNANDSRAVEDLRASMDAHDQQLTDAEEAAAHLSSEWKEFTSAYRRAEATYVSARASFERARLSSAQTTEAFDLAAQDFADAAQLWRWYQQLVLIAASIDASNLDAYRSWRDAGFKEDAEPFSCGAVSTASFRERLVAAGINVLGKDVDHIVPSSLGGADHPSNYQLLDSSENRSLGNTWNTEKCVAAGDRCAAAVAVSEKCGAYSGGMP